MVSVDCTAALVAGVRRDVPEVQAVRESSRTATLRYQDLSVILTDDGDVLDCVLLRAMARVMASMFDDRRDDFTSRQPRAVLQPAAARSVRTTLGSATAREWSISRSIMLGGITSERFAAWARRSVPL